MGSESTIRNDVGSLDKALRLISVLARSRKPLGLAALADQAGLPKTTCHRILQTLLRWRLVEKSRDHRYSLGTWILELSGQYLETSDLRADYRPILEAARELTGEAVCLIVKEGSFRICIDFVPSRQPIAYNPRLGETLPLSIGASGRAFLADLAEHDGGRASVASLCPDVDTHSLDVLLKQAAEERKRGYFISCGDRPGMNGLAIPMMGLDQRVLATISIVGPTDRWTPERMHATAPQIFKIIEGRRASSYLQ